MKVMKPAELPSTGEELMSTFHQLFGGKSGCGTPSGPPCVAPCNATARGSEIRNAIESTARRMRRVFAPPSAGFVTALTADFRPESESVLLLPQHQLGLAILVSDDVTR